MLVDLRRTSLVLMALMASTELFAQQRCEADVAQQSTPTTRFQDNGDGTVTDVELKLMWTRCSVGQTWNGKICDGQASTHTWDSASQAASDVNSSGTYFYNDWRLPQLKEIATLIERRCSNPRVNLSVFPNTPAGIFWSSTQRPGTGEVQRVYALSFGDDGVDYQTRDQRNHVRLVRPSQ